MKEMRHTALGGRVGVLDLLRLLAALAVVFFHLGFRGRTLEFTDFSLPDWEPVLKYGYLGVQVFFVISGFVIAYSAEGRAPMQFAIARFARIYPMFVLCMTLTFLVIINFGAPYMSATTSQWVANLIVKPELLGQEAMDGSYWSIFYEIVFYGWIFALMALGLFKRSMYPVIIAVWLVVSVIDRMFFGSSLMRYLLLTDQSGFFCAGLVLYAAFRDGYTPRNLLLIGLSIAVAMYQSVELAQWNRVHYATSYSDIVVALSCLVIVAIIAVAIRIRQTFLPQWIMLALGGLSYPLYLLHQHIGYVILNNFAAAATSNMMIVATVLLLIGISYLFWRFIDRPAQQLVKSALTRLFYGGMDLSRPEAGVRPGE